MFDLDRTYRALAFVCFSFFYVLRAVKKILKETKKTAPTKSGPSPRSVNLQFKWNQNYYEERICESVEILVRNLYVIELYLSPFCDERQPKRHLTTSLIVVKTFALSDSGAIQRTGTGVLLWHRR